MLRMRKLVAISGFETMSFVIEVTAVRPTGLAGRVPAVGRPPLPHRDAACRTAAPPAGSGPVHLHVRLRVFKP
jgi:hypothetical protein